MNRFALAYREQQQLFLFDKTYLLGTLLKVGGLSTLTGRFIVQFFWNPTPPFAFRLGPPADRADPLCVAGSLAVRQCGVF